MDGANIISWQSKDGSKIILWQSKDCANMIHSMAVEGWSKYNITAV